MELYNIQKISNTWQMIAPLLSAPQTDAEYDNLVSFLDHLIDEIGSDENHPLASLMDTVGILIEAYDNEHYPFSEGDAANVLKYFMELEGLTQKDMPEVGSQGVISEILSGKRKLNIRQIKAVSKRFNVSPATFV
jgi:HTH-type transcriptional regulator / antitoxin HigA